MIWGSEAHIARQFRTISKVGCAVGYTARTDDFGHDKFDLINGQRIKVTSHAGPTFNSVSAFSSLLFVLNLLVCVLLARWKLELLEVGWCLCLFTCLADLNTQEDGGYYDGPMEDPIQYPSSATGTLDAPSAMPSYQSDPIGDMEASGRTSSYQEPVSDETDL